MKPCANADSELRLQVFLSRSGLCSRRQAMAIVQTGKVSVNGQVIREPSFKINPQKDKVVFQDKVIEYHHYEYVLLNKPAGYVTTLEDSHAEKIVLDLLPENLKHLKPVGRLDKDTEGLLLLTNDGDVAYKLTHPKFNVDKVYHVEIKGQLTELDKVDLEEGVVVEGQKTFPARVERVKFLKDRTTLQMTIHEGRKRQIRLMFRSLGYHVVYLKRIIQGPLGLGDLKPGELRMLTMEEIRKLKSP